MPTPAQMKAYWEDRRERQRSGDAAYQTAYWADYIERHKEKLRGKGLRKTYSLPLEVYNTLLDGQSFACAICHKPDFADGRPLYVDHDHKTGWVRGLLCAKCNTGLGFFKDSPERIEQAVKGLSFFEDDPERIQRAVEYLRFHSREGKLKVGAAHDQGRAKGLLPQVAG